MNNDPRATPFALWPSWIRGEIARYEARIEQLPTWAKRPDTTHEGDPR